MTELFYTSSFTRNILWLAHTEWSTNWLRLLAWICAAAWHIYVNFRHFAASFARGSCCTVNYCVTSWYAWRSVLASGRQLSKICTVLCNKYPTSEIFSCQSRVILAHAVVEVGIISLNERHTNVSCELEVFSCRYIVYWWMLSSVVNL